MFANCIHTYLNIKICFTLKFIHFLEEAKAKYGEDKIKIYKSVFTPMYYALTEHKVKCSMKLVCLLPTEKVSYLP